MHSMLYISKSVPFFPFPIPFLRMGFFLQEINLSNKLWDHFPYQYFSPIYNSDLQFWLVNKQPFVIYHYTWEPFLFGCCNSYIFKCKMAHLLLLLNFNSCTNRTLPMDKEGKWEWKMIAEDKRTQMLLLHQSPLWGQ